MPSKKHRHFIVAALVAISLISTGFAQQATKPVAAGRLVEIKVPAPSLKGNLPGDPLEQSVAIYLPPSYETSPTKRFPTLYPLHGFTGNNRAWTTKGYQGMSLQPFMDDLIKAGVSREMIVVAPNALNAYKGSFYTNSSVTGNWEDYIYRDLVQHIDANYRTIARTEVVA
ncbi:MAG TPA: alpha/beta hydrolase-fold protein [Pyrinomonadaceae bacterium]